MKNRKAKDLIGYLVEYIKYRLSEIAESKGEATDEFLGGETQAYTECLEIILLRMGASREELLKIEKRYGVG